LITCYIAPKNNYVSFIELKDLNYKGEFKQQQQKTKLNGFPFFFVHILLIGHTQYFLSVTKQKKYCLFQTKNIALKEDLYLDQRLIPKVKTDHIHHLQGDANRGKWKKTHCFARIKTNSLGSMLQLYVLKQP
jgi:hypothetical protein